MSDQPNNLLSIWAQRDFNASLSRDMLTRDLILDAGIAEIGEDVVRRNLFNASEPGVFLDPDHLSTLFQDTAGNTPVTAPGQSVALVLDKSRGLVRGANIATSTSVTGVAAGGPAFTNYQIAPAMVVGRAYEISFTVSGYAGTGSVGIGNAGVIFSPVPAGIETSANGALRFIAIAATTDIITVFTRSTNTANFSAISVRELPGNHATQATAGSRPLYALLPANGVRNLANGSADTTNFSVWATSGTANGITITRSGAGIDVDGLPFADYTVVGTATAADRRFLISSGFRIPASVGRQFAISATVQRTVGSAPPAGCGVALDALGETAPVTYVEGGGNLGLPVDAATATTFTRTYTLANAASNQATGVVTIETANGATVNYTVRIKALQFELGSTRTAYQFNYSNVNIAQPPFAQVGALLFDGVDDFLQTPSVDFAGYEQLGSELVTNGDFAGGTTGWTTQTGWSISAGAASVNSAAAGTTNLISTSVAVTAGRAYSITYTISSVTGSGIRAVIGGTVDGNFRTAPGTYTSIVTAASTASFQITASSTDTVGTVDNVSVKEVLRPADKMTVFAGVRKLSDAATAILVEAGADSSVNSGTFGIIAPSAAGVNSYRWTARGTIVLTSGNGAFAPAPDSAVLSATADISGDTTSFRRNNAVVQAYSSDFGTGNFANSILYIGRRTGTTFPFSGYLYSLIVRGAATPADLITLTERWINSKAGAY